MKIADVSFKFNVSALQMHKIMALATCNCTTGGFSTAYTTPEILFHFVSTMLVF